MARSRRRPAAQTFSNTAIPNSLIASAAILRPDKNLVIRKESWQDEAWSYYDSLGEFEYAIDWKSSAMSRVRLRAAKMVPGSDEPEFVNDGPIEEVVQSLAGGVGGQSSMLKSFTVKLDVPGDSYLIGEETDGEIIWSVFSSETVQSDRSGQFKIRVEESVWRPLSRNSIVIRVWIPDERFPWKATSPTKAALGTMREIDLYNRHIISTLVSRLAFNGLLLIPREVTFPVNEQFENEADPFVAELIDIASKSIENPGSASAAIPIPIKVPAQYIEQFKHLILASGVTKEVLDAREKSLLRLAKMVNIPQEILTGMGDVNHWSGWQLEDSAIKIHIAPLAETICHGLTKGFLVPSLKAQNLPLTDSDGGRYLIWYDTSELSMKPNIGERAIQLHDRAVITDDALREAAGFNDVDAPDAEQLRTQVLRHLAFTGADVSTAYTALFETPSSGDVVPDTTEDDGNAILPDSTSEPDDGLEEIDIPDTLEDEPSGMAYR